MVSHRIPERDVARAGFHGHRLRVNIERSLESLLNFAQNIICVAHLILSFSVIEFDLLIGCSKILRP
jgi:6-pyruvoyl-tetrahydropterin synthase